MELKTSPKGEYIKRSKHPLKSILYQKVYGRIGKGAKIDSRPQRIANTHILITPSPQLSVPYPTLRLLLRF